MLRGCIGIFLFLQRSAKIHQSDRIRSGVAVVEKCLVARVGIDDFSRVLDRAPELLGARDDFPGVIDDTCAVAAGHAQFGKGGISMSKLQRSNKESKKQAGGHIPSMIREN
jgi:hypothetical protein